LAFVGIYLTWLKFLHFYLIYLFFHCRVKAKKAEQQEKETAHSSADQEAEDQTADQRGDAASQSRHHRSVGCFIQTALFTHFLF